MRAAIYDRVSAADVGLGLPGRLAELRKYAIDVRGWEVVLEIGDAGPWIHGRRPGLAQLAALIHRGGCDVVVTRHLWRLFRSLGHLSTFAHRLLEGGIALVATQDLVDTTDLAGRVRFLELSDTLTAFSKAQRSEASKVARIRGALRGSAGDNWGRPMAEVNLLELAGYWHGSDTRRPLSIGEIASRLKLSRTTVRKRLAELRDAGRLEDALRTQRIAASGGLRKGGRPSRRRKVKDEELAAIYHGGQSLTAIRKYWRTSQGSLQRELERLTAEGLIDPARRQAAVERRKRR